ncbi:hypothetical protein Bca52824_068461 [Brassica carinata]|uniref:Uncharacterized protein n=1 Tax=Brassica carinata TaxID=52824 RepID=A0A8X7Q1M1_BRACI|nr:hypothetical protein Bca52824_068461 [Brassica carinata]
MDKNHASAVRTDPEIDILSGEALPVGAEASGPSLAGPSSADDDGDVFGVGDGGDEADEGDEFCCRWLSALPLVLEDRQRRRRDNRCKFLASTKAMPKRAAEPPPSSETQGVKPADSFGDYRSQVSQLLSREEKISHRDQEATMSHSNTVIGAGMSHLKKEDLNVLLRQCVTKHEDAPESEWRGWNWRSEGDMLLNGAYFRQSGAELHRHMQELLACARPSSLVGSITTTAGTLSCRRGRRC